MQSEAIHTVVHQCISALHWKAKWLILSYSLENLIILMVYVTEKPGDGELGSLLGRRKT